MKYSAYLLIFLAGLGLVAGCQSGPLGWALRDKPDKTSYMTASMRMDAVKDIARKADRSDTPEQREITDQLARQIQIEPDPLVREAIVEALTGFNTPLAQQVLEAGLKDADSEVRRKACVALGKRAQPSSVAGLADTLRNDTENDVRIAAADALGQIKSPESVRALTAALEDRSPALQFVGVRAMKSLTGQDFDGDVARCLEVARSENPTLPDKSRFSVAERVRGLSPF